MKPSFVLYARGHATFTSLLAKPWTTSGTVLRARLPLKLNPSMLTQSSLQAPKLRNWDKKKHRLRLTQIDRSLSKLHTKQQTTLHLRRRKPNLQFHPRKRRSQSHLNALIRRVACRKAQFQRAPQTPWELISSPRFLPQTLESRCPSL